MLIAPPNVTVIEPFCSMKRRLPPFVYGFPFGLGYLAAVLERENIEVSIVDANTFTMTISEIMKKVEAYRPGVIGITSGTAVIRVAVALSMAIRQYNKNIKVVLGGPHASFDFKNMLSLECVDYVVIGEGEETFLELCMRLDKGEDIKDVKGLAFRNGDEIIITASRPPISDLDSLPLPARHLVDFHKYIFAYAGIKSNVSIISSRGCSHRCAFCSSGWLMRNWRGRSAENIMTEIKTIVHDYPQVRAFSFVDDDFCVNKNRVIRFCELMKQEHMDHFWWSCTARVDQLDDETVDIMKSAGCHRFYLGIESGSQDVLRQIGKGTNISQIKKTISMLKKKKLEVYSFFMIGNPGETINTINQTRKLALDLKSTNSGWFITQVYPGTRLAKLQPATNWLEYLYKPELDKPSLYTHPCVPCFNRHGLDREKLKKICDRITKQFIMLHVIRNFSSVIKKFFADPSGTIGWIFYIFSKK